MIRILTLAASVAFAMGAAPVAAAPTDRPAAFSLALPVTPGAGSRVQLLMVPAAALATMRTRDGRDLRVFDSLDRPMPMARAAMPARIDRVPLTPLPILGPAETKAAGLSLRLDRQGRPRLLTVEGEAASPGGGVLLGILFDTRGKPATATGLAITADLPVGQPIALTLEASRDLNRWREVAVRTLYRAPGADRVSDTLTFDEPRAAGEWLRLTWSGPSRLLGPVVVRQAALLARADGALPTVSAKAPPPADPHTIGMALPFATPIVSIRLIPAPADAVVPVNIYGRADREHPWVPIGSGTATSDDETNDTIMLDPLAATDLRIAAYERSPGFTAPPEVRFGFAPQAVLFLAAGTPPYRLAVGQAEAADTFLPPDSLTRRGVAATAIVGAAAPALLLQSPEEGGARSLLLWAVLLAATGLLGAMAWVLLRRSTARAAGEGTHGEPTG